MIRLEARRSAARLLTASRGIAEGPTSLLHHRPPRKTNRRERGERRDGRGRMRFALRHMAAARENAFPQAAVQSAPRRRAGTGTVLSPAPRDTL